MEIRDFSLVQNTRPIYIIELVERFYGSDKKHSFGRSFSMIVVETKGESVCLLHFSAACDVMTRFRGL